MEGIFWVEEIFSVFLWGNVFLFVKWYKKLQSFICFIFKKFYWKELNQPLDDSEKIPADFGGQQSSGADKVRPHVGHSILQSRVFCLQNPILTLDSVKFGPQLSQNLRVHLNRARPKGLFIILIQCPCKIPPKVIQFSLNIFLNLLRV